MLKSPKKTKYKSPHLYLSNKGLKGLGVSESSCFIVKSKSQYLFTAKQHELCRRSFARTMKEAGRSINIRFFPHLSKTKKPLQMRMGKGKGKHSKWVTL